MRILVVFRPDSTRLHSLQIELPVTSCSKYLHTADGEGVAAAGAELVRGRPLAPTGVDVLRAGHRDRDASPVGGHRRRACSLSSDDVDDDESADGDGDGGRAARTASRVDGGARVRRTSDPPGPRRAEGPAESPTPPLPGGLDASHVGALLRDTKRRASEAPAWRRISRSMELDSRRRLHGGGSAVGARAALSSETMASASRSASSYTAERTSEWAGALDAWPSSSLLGNSITSAMADDY
ncbi:hypothetical protein P43SY_011127 [Pythium insidiosum]|uniref:Uncharacterized protein n=1 Tax=Pythium insidiosum TaxID=114742 RepID=A0AAD5Q576_PYTIN|nr:hypothetical protein P43SY_011127 [Pythium insidiosum]